MERPGGRPAARRIDIGMGSGLCLDAARTGAARTLGPCADSRLRQEPGKCTFSRTGRAFQNHRVGKASLVKREGQLPFYLPITRKILEQHPRQTFSKRSTFSTKIVDPPTVTSTGNDEYIPTSIVVVLGTT